MCILARVGSEPDQLSQPSDGSAHADRAPILNYANADLFKKPCKPWTANRVARWVAFVVISSAAAGIWAGRNDGGSLALLPVWFGGLVYMIARVAADRRGQSFAKTQMAIAGVALYLAMTELILRGNLDAVRWGLDDLRWVLSDLIYVLRPARVTVGYAAVALVWFAAVDVTLLFLAWRRRVAERAAKTLR